MAGLAALVWLDYVFGWSGWGAYRFSQHRGRARDLEAIAAELLAELGGQEVNASSPQS